MMPHIAVMIFLKLGYEMNPQSVDPSSQAYKHFSTDSYPEGNITTMDYVEGDAVHIMMDFNRYPQTCALGQVRGDLFIVFDEIVSDNATTTEQAMNVVARLNAWGIDHVYLFGDNTSNQRSGRFGRTGKNDWDYVRDQLSRAKITFTSKLKVQNPKRTVRVDKVNNIIYNPATDYLESIVDDDGVKKDNGKIGHMSDAVDYWVFANAQKSTGLTYVFR